MAKIFDWNVRSIFLGANSPDELEDELNAQDALGWEVFAIVPSPVLLQRIIVVYRKKL